MMSLELMFLVMAMVMVFTLGSEYGKGQINKLNKRKAINNRREELKSSSLQSIPYNHVENLEANFVNDEYGHKEFKLATLIVTSKSGRRFVVDKDLRGTDSYPMELTSFANKPAASVKTYLSNIDVIDVISKHVSFEVTTEVERYHAFQKTIDNIYRGKHWLTKDDMASVEIRFFDLTYSELRTIAEPEQSIFYFDRFKTPVKRTKTQELLDKVNDTVIAAEVAFARYEDIVSQGKQIVEDIIEDTLNGIKILSNNSQESMLAYAYAGPVVDEQYITDEELKDIKSFTVDKTKEHKDINSSNKITLDKIQSVLENARTFVKNKDIIEYDITMDMDDAVEIPFNINRHNRSKSQDKRNKKNKRKQKFNNFN